MACQRLQRSRRSGKLLPALLHIEFDEDLQLRMPRLLKVMRHASKGFERGHGAQRHVVEFLFEALLNFEWVTGHEG